MPSNIDIPWDWYVVRASALIGFLLLYISVFTGTVSGLPGIKKFFLRLRSLNFHRWISLQALLFAIIHGVALLFHKYISFDLGDILIPFHSDYKPLFVGLGTVSLYLMIILVATSYGRKYISQKVWRSIHFLNILLYIFSITHALLLGTDLKSGLPREIFIWANGILLLLLFFNLSHKIWSRTKGEQINLEIPNVNENLRQSDSAGGQERTPENFRRRV